MAEMETYGLAKTTGRSVVGTMTDFASLATHFRSESNKWELLRLSLRLSEVPCGQLRGGHRFPADEVLATVEGLGY